MESLPQILTKDDEVFEYKINQDIYKYFKGEQDDENDDGDKIKIYFICLNVKFGNQDRTYFKDYPDNIKERDDFFRNLKAESVNDFTGWK